MAVETLCWKCGKACNNGCSWSDHGEPVKGWTIGEDKSVILCPEYVRDSRIKDIDEDGAHNLIAAMIKQIASDYERGTPEMCLDLERYVKSKRFTDICDIEPTRLIKLMQMKRKARITALLRDCR